MTDFEKKIERGLDATFRMVESKGDDTSPGYREYRRKWAENPKKGIVGDFPIHLDLEGNTNCNLKCFMCFQSFDPPKKEVMDMALFKKAIDEGAKKGLCSIKTMYRGEPLVNPNMVDMIRYAKQNGVIEAMFNTNANLLTDKKARELIDAGLDKIICSVDGCTKEVYESIRIGGNFETVVKNIKNLQKIKKELGLKKPVVRVQMVSTPKNKQQTEEYIKFWSPIADQVAVEDMLDWEGEEEDATPLEEFACAQLWQRLVVLADGDVLPCCRAMLGATEKLEVLGNLKDQTLEEIWRGKHLNALRELHRRGESHRIRMCRLCGIRKQVLIETLAGKRVK
ncbi:MAG: radical SAM protein [Candidatus Altiarchaeota archaeon]|nr:radical SAM protein [Candidatus Altiarchaeota archaeon]